MSNISLMETDAGIIPSLKSVNYDITTQQVQEYLQAKFDDLAKNGAPKVHVSVATSERYGRKFYPIFVALPKAVIEDSGNSGDDNKLSSLFMNASRKESPKLNQLIYKFLSIFSYGNTDFTNDQVRHSLGVSRSDAQRLNSFRAPVVIDNKVIVMLDPIAIFYRMLNWKADNHQYVVNVTHVQKQKQGEFLYNIVREFAKPNKNRNNRGRDAAINKILNG